MIKLIVSALSALVFAGAVAQPAAADNPGAGFNDLGIPGKTVGQYCATPSVVGVPGVSQLGHFVDGCTVRARCPFTYCKVVGSKVHPWLSDTYAKLTSSTWTGRQYINMRLRAYDANGYLRWYRDFSCGHTSATVCPLGGEFGQIVRYGETVTAQANGVFENPGSRATAFMRVQLVMEWL